MFKSFLNKLTGKGKPTNRRGNNRNQQQYRPKGVPSGNKKENYFLYVLKLGNGGLYVGITNNPDRRYKEHTSGQGSKVTKTFGVQGVISCEPLGYMTYAQAEKYEDDRTLALMQQYGYSSVRGGHWCMINDKAIYSALVNNRKRIWNDFNRDVQTMLF